MDKNVERVCERLSNRADAGLKKYGVTTERDDLGLAEWIQHLQDELLDAVVYSERLKSEAQWMPINTAPAVMSCDDPEMVLLWVPTGNDDGWAALGYVLCDKDGERYSQIHGEWTQCEPSHWMRIPSPP